MRNFERSLTESGVNNPPKKMETKPRKSNERAKY